MRCGFVFKPVFGTALSDMSWIPFLVSQPFIHMREHAEIVAATKLWRGHRVSLVAELLCDKPR